MFTSDSKYGYVFGGIFIILLIVGFGLLMQKKVQPLETPKEIQTPISYKDATYMIDGVLVSLTNGVSQIPSEDSSSSIITTYFGNEVFVDLNNDGQEDVVFLVTQETGGTGFFYYVVPAIKKGVGYVGGQALFLGDRIAPQTTEKRDNGIVVVNYADRRPGEAFSVRPSQGKSIWLKLDPETLQFGEVVQDFEGEADPSRMSLGMKKWVWESLQYNDGREIIPKKTGAFILSFSSDGTFSASTDCNGIGGNYVVKGNQITFTNMISTLMFCEGSQEADFSNLLTNTASFFFTSRGQLILELKFDSGTAMFR